MKILFAASSLSYGGAEKMLCFVANGLCEMKHSIYIANLLEERDESQQLCDDISVERIETANTRYIEKIEKISKLRKYILSIKPDIIVAFKSTPAWITCLANIGTGIPVVFSERGDPYQENLRRWRTYPYWKLINHAAGAVFQTDGAKEYFEDELQSRSTVIPNPIAPINEEETIDLLEDKSIVSFGRFENRQKRYDVMINAFGIFHITHPQYKLKLYGNGEDEQTIRQWVKEKGLEDAIELPGYAGTPYKLMRHGNIFLITSDYEGISNAMLEAMAAGFPVISTDSSPGGARMVIQDKENGLLVPIGDVQGIADALALFADDMELRERCAHNAKEVTERYNPQKILDQWEQYLFSVVDRKTQRKE